MIKEYVEKLNNLTESGWCRYAFCNEPLSGKLEPGQRLEYYRKAAECGSSLAMSLKGRFGELSISEFAEKENVIVNYDDTEYDSIYTMFSKFVCPDDITIYLKNARATDDLIAQNGLSAISGSIRTEELLLAHELFHYYENSMPDLYINKKHVLLFKIGRFEHRSRIMCLSEIAAMHFAKTLTGLPCSPYIYDVLMLYARNPQRGKQQYERILRITKGENL